MEDGDYQPIDCNLYDRLLVLASQRQQCQIIYCDGRGQQQVAVRTRLKDVYTCQKAEFLRLEDGREIRLDRLIEVHLDKPEGNKA